MTRTVRRIVTGHDAQGRSIVLSDAPVSRTHELPGAKFFEVWATEGSPTPIRPAEPREPTERDLRIGPPPQGSYIRIIDFPPPSAGGQRSPMHRTRTVDYGIVLEGEMVMLLDDGSEVPLEAGDVVIQRGTNHAWENRSSAMARMAFILLDGEFTAELRERLPDMHLMA